MSAIDDRIHRAPAERPARAAGGALLWWRSRFHPGLQILERGAHAHPYGNHLHESLKIAWLLSGTTVVSCRGRAWRLRAGDAFLAAPLEPHGGRALEGTPLSFVALYVPQTIVGEIEQATRAGPGLPLPSFAVHVQGLDLYQELVARLREAQSPARQIEVLASTLHAFLAPARAGIPSGRGTTHRAVRRMQALLDAAFAERVTAGDLARAAHLHERYAISLFKRALGIPPHQYLIARRVERARLLLGDRQSPSAAAASAGFTDQSHFTRIFRNTYGCTPRAYQRALCG